MATNLVEPMNPAPAPIGPVYISADRVCVGILVAVIIVILLVVIFHRQIKFLFRATLATLDSMMTGDDPRDLLPEYETLDNGAPAKGAAPAPAGAVELPAGQTSDALMAMGYTGSVSWNEVIAFSELDPAQHLRQMEFVKDVKRYSSGPNFTDVAGDNNSFAFTNFVGLRRPQGVAIGASARQVPDIDEDVLLRNKRFVI